MFSATGTRELYAFETSTLTLAMWLMEIGKLEAQKFPSWKNGLCFYLIGYVLLSLL